MDLKSEIQEVNLEDESAANGYGSDDSSVIFISDMSVSEVESVNLDEDEEEDVLVADLTEDSKELVREDMQVVTETTTTTEVITTTLEETVLKIDKATQTYENEFPVKSIVSPGILALRNTAVPNTTSTSSNQISLFNSSALNGSSILAPQASASNKQINILSVSALNSLSVLAPRDTVLSKGSTSNNLSIVPVVSTLNNQKNTAVDSINKSSDSNAGKNSSSSSTSKSKNSNAVDKDKNSGKNVSISTSSKSNRSNEVSNKENRDNNDSASYYDKNSRNSVRRTWTKSRSYQNHRVQPYQRYNQQQNYYSGRQDNYNRYGGRSQDDYYNNRYNDNSYGYRSRYRSDYYNNNRCSNNSYGYNAQPYNSYTQRGWQVRNYTYQFKERLFTGFVRFMDFVFQYDYNRN